jgi:predicted membrane protein
LWNARGQAKRNFSVSNFLFFILLFLLLFMLILMLHGFFYNFTHHHPFPIPHEGDQTDPIKKKSPDGMHSKRKERDKKPEYLKRRDSLLL